MFNVTIDGKTIEVPEGTTVLRAAEMAGVKIPTLCDHKQLSPYGGCRLCLVEVEGARTLQPSCTLPVNNNMVVRTATPQVKASREFVLTLIFSERNHFCMYCQVSNGDCELQNAAYGEGMTHWPLQPTWQKYAVDASNPFFVLDNNRCILCRRCVRACGELVGNFTLGFEERGANSFLVADLGTPLGESTCVSCGTCVQVCPTGALIDRVSAYRGRETQVDHHLTVCTECSLGCGADVMTRDNHLVRIDGNWDAPVNSGILCKLGRFEPLEEKRERVLTPMLRKNGTLKASTWDEALSVISAKLGQGSVAALASTRLPVEALNAFAQVFAGSDMATSLEEGAYTAAASALADDLRQPFEGTLDDLKTAGAVLLFGVDLTHDHEVASFFVKRNLPAGAALVIADSKINSLDNLAGLALHGSEADLIAGLSAAVDQPEMLDAIAARAGIPAESFKTAVQLLTGANRPVIVYGKSVMALKPLAGLAAKLNGVLFSTKGAANSLAAAQLGLDKPFKLNGHQAVYVALGDEAPSQSLITRLQGVPFLAVQASYVSQLTAAADVILPVTTWAEQAGHFVSADGRVQVTERVLLPADDIRTNAEVLAAVATKMGCALSGDWQAQLSKRAAPVAIKA